MNNTNKIIVDRPAISNLVCPACNLSIPADDPPPRGDFIVCKRCLGVFGVSDTGSPTLVWLDDTLFFTTRNKWFNQI